MALFKIFKGNNTERLTNPSTTAAGGYIQPIDGYAYYDTSSRLFYIDAEYPVLDENQQFQYNENNELIVSLKRAPINANLAWSAAYDGAKVPQRIDETYIKGLRYATANNALIGIKGNGAEDINITLPSYTFTNGTTGTFTVTLNSGTAQTVSIGKPATAGTADKINITDTTPAAATSYYPVYASSASGVQELRANTDLYYWDNGTTSYLNIGSTSHLGGLSLHSANGKYGNLTPSNFTANRSLIVPDKDGTIAITTDLDTKANIANPIFTGCVTINGNTNQLLNVTSVRTSYAGASGETPRYIPGKWRSATGRDPQNGDIYILQLPEASTAAGIYLSVNGTADADYHPLILNTTAMMTTHFAAGTTLMLVYENSSIGSIYALEPTTNDKVNITGIFRVINYYDTNTNTLLRTYASSSANELPIIGSAASTSMGVPAHTSSYKDYYGGIPATVANRPVIKLSTGVLRSPAGIALGTGKSKTGLLTFYSSSTSYTASIIPDTLSANITITLPSTTGTLALTSDLTPYALKASPAFTGIPTAPTAEAGTNNTQIATTAFVQNALITNNALVFKGVINSSNDLPTPHKLGWTYKIGTAGSYAGQICEVGDTIYCITDGTFDDPMHWVVVQTNIDGAVIGPASSVAGHIATFTGTTGKGIQDSGILATSLAPKASPALTGIPTAPTAAASTSSTQIATTAFVHAAIMSYLYDGSSQVVS